MFCFFSGGHNHRCALCIYGGDVLWGLVADCLEEGLAGSFLDTRRTMTEIIDKSYFLELSTASPATLCRQGRCSYDSITQQYSLSIWGEHYNIDVLRGRIDHPAAGSHPPHEYLDLFAMYYLLRGKDSALRGEWVSEKDLPGGPTFFRGPHLIPTELITKRFGNDLEEFNIRCGQLGGSQIAMADAAFRLAITADIPAAVLYWIGDEDFPAEAKILYDRSITDHLSLDIVWALAVGICARLGAAE